MKDLFVNRSWHCRGNGAEGESPSQEPPRIRLDVPMGTSYYEIQESIFRQAWQLAGTQLRAAVALGITPDTISRFLRRCDRMRNDRPQALATSPMALPPKPGHRATASASAENGPEVGRWSAQEGSGEDLSPARAILGDQVNQQENQVLVALTSSSENAQEEIVPSPDPSDDFEGNEW